ncbi:hypothetical protein, partial [Vibrio parahaemolyticus]
VRLAKFAASQYTIDKLPTNLEAVAYTIGEVFDFLEKNKLSFSKENLLNLLDNWKASTFSNKNRAFFVIVF